MSHLVETTHGLIARDRLETKDVVTEDDNARTTATEWYLAGELVRRDVWVSALQGLKIGAETNDGS
jgi:hypothetical protein